MQQQRYIEKYTKTFEVKQLMASCSLMTYVCRMTKEELHAQINTQAEAYLVKEEVQ